MVDNGPTQIPLDFGLNDELTFDTFIGAGNEQLTQTLINLQPASEFQYLNWWGPAARGKSHLLQAVCHQWTAQGFKAICLDVDELMTMPVEVCTGLESLDLVALDNIHKLPMHGRREQQENSEHSALSAAWEEAIFHLYNRLHQQEKTLLLTADKAPRDIPLALNDLKSRLMSGLSTPLHEVNDATKKSILIKKAAQRKFELGEEVVEFLMARTARDMPSLMAAFERIDAYSLAQKRKITIPFLKQALSIT